MYNGYYPPVPGSKPKDDLWLRACENRLNQIPPGGPLPKLFACLFTPGFCRSEVSFSDQTFFNEAFELFYTILKFDLPQTVTKERMMSVLLECLPPDRGDLSAIVCAIRDVSFRNTMIATFLMHARRKRDMVVDLPLNMRAHAHFLEHNNLDVLLENQSDGVRSFLLDSNLQSLVVTSYTCVKDARRALRTFNTFTEVLLASKFPIELQLTVDGVSTKTTLTMTKKIAGLEWLEFNIRRLGLLAHDIFDVPALVRDDGKMGVFVRSKRGQLEVSRVNEPMSQFLQPGDIVEAVNGNEVREANIHAELLKHANTTVSLSVYRHPPVA